MLTEYYRTWLESKKRTTVDDIRRKVSSDELSIARRRWNAGRTVDADGQVSFDNDDPMYKILSKKHDRFTRRRKKYESASKKDIAKIAKKQLGMK